ncbi:class II aldolase/adducin family protein [Mycobacteroides abscessus]|uniref:class II aldolase/adducin family protein n=1 Tax=Mycobacteroides abscessus TaxID=36809 RepID=UPI0019D2F0A8|nr:class II aldolase/adducin family protein [Mycobacteroides abscessus]
MVGSADGVQLGPAAAETVTQERERRLRELAAAFRIFGTFGFSEGVAGHITVRDPEFPDTFWVNPFGMNFRHITVSDLIQVDHDGNVITGSRPVNRAAFCIHSEVHKARPDVIAAAHAHSVHGKAFSSLGQPLLPITQDACAFYQDHAVYTDYRGVVGDLEEGRAIGSALGPAKAVILQVSGQVGIDPHTESLVGGTVYAQTLQALRNVQAILTAAGADFEDVLMLRVFLNAPEGFAELNQAFADYLQKPYPARTTLFGGLPPGLLVEIDALAKISAARQ